MLITDTIGMFWLPGRKNGEYGDQASDGPFIHKRVIWTMPSAAPEYWRLAKGI
jgi:hypothetical protein